MRIIYLHQYYKTSKKAGSSRSYEISKHLVDNGHEVIMIGGNKIDSDDIYNDFPERFDYISTGTKYSNHMSFKRRVISFLHYAFRAIILGKSITDADIIYATSTPLTVGISAIILSKKLKIPFIFEVRDVWPEVPIGLKIIKNKLIISFLEKLELTIYKKAKHIIALSDGMRDSILKKGISKNKITVVTNFSNIEFFNKDKVNRENVRKKYNFTSKQFICIHSGAMGFVNGLDYILDSAKYIYNYDKNIIFLLIGEGREKERLRKRIIDEKIYNVIILDSISKKDIRDIVVSSDVGLVCFINNNVLFNNSANKFFDYLAAGLPIIINYGGWQKSVLSTYSAGFSVDENDYKDMAKKILKLKNYHQFHKEMGKRALLLAKEKYRRNMGCIVIERILLETLKKNYN
jgi:glycosyltransferase involved in cell wall biosynthesis